MGPTYRSIHTALHRVAPSHIESSSINFSQFKKNLWCECVVFYFRFLFLFQSTLTRPNPHLHRTRSTPPHYRIQPILTHPNITYIKTQPIKLISTQTISRVTYTGVIGRRCIDPDGKCLLAFWFEDKEAASGRVKDWRVGMARKSSASVVGELASMVDGARGVSPADRWSSGCVLG